jgi:hypothetical protein
MEPNKPLRRRDKLLNLLPSRSRGSSPFPSTPAAAATTPGQLYKTASSVDAHGETAVITVAPQPSITSISSSQPSAQATTSGDVKTSSCTDHNLTTPERLWDRAYDELKREEADLLFEYERILSYILKDNDPGSQATRSQANTIIQHDADRRRNQMQQLVHTGLRKTAREAHAKESISSAMNVVLAVKDTIGFAIQSVPQAALAWTGVSIALQVSRSIYKTFAH